MSKEKIKILPPGIPDGDATADPALMREGIEPLFPQGFAECVFYKHVPSLSNGPMTPLTPSGSSKTYGARPCL